MVFFYIELYSKMIFFIVYSFFQNNEPWHCCPSMKMSKSGHRHSDCVRSMDRTLACLEWLSKSSCSREVQTPPSGTTCI